MAAKNKREVRHKGSWNKNRRLATQPLYFLRLAIAAFLPMLVLLTEAEPSWAQDQQTVSLAAASITVSLSDLDPPTLADHRAIKKLMAQHQKITVLVERGGTRSFRASTDERADMLRLILGKLKDKVEVRINELDRDRSLLSETEELQVDLVGCIAQALLLDCYLH